MKGAKKDYVQQLAEVQLNKTQAEILLGVLADKNRNEDQKFGRARDIIFDALVRQAVGDAEYSKLCLSAVQKTRTVMKLVKDKNDAKQSR